MKSSMVVGLVVTLAAVAGACPKGSIEFNNSCTYELTPADSGSVDSSKWVSDEKPPRTTTGEWQTGKYPIVQLPSQTIDAEAASIQKWTDAHKAK